MIQETDFLNVSFSVREEGGRLAETTDAEEAKKENLFDERKPYGPSLVILKDARLLKGFKEALLKAELNQKTEVKIPFAEAFGPRQEDLVRLVPLQKFREQGMDPVPGMTVTMDDYPARVQSVSGGRVRVDFNHELAGKNILYSFIIEKQVTTPEEKLEALLHEFPVLKGNPSLQKGVAEVTVPSGVTPNADYLSAKYAVVQKALLYIPEITKVVWKEEFTK